MFCNKLVVDAAAASTIWNISNKMVDMDMDMDVRRYRGWMLGLVLEPDVATPYISRPREY